MVQVIFMICCIFCDCAGLDLGFTQTA